MGFPNNKITNGAAGGAYIADTSPRTGQWFAVQVLADAKFHTLTGNISGIANTTDANAPVIPAGSTIFGYFTALQLHSGRVVACNN